MHPVLARRIRLDLYLLAWVPVAVLVSAALAVPEHRSLLEAVLLGVPLTLLAAFMSMAQWPMCRALPLDGSNPFRFFTSHVASLVASVGVWVGAVALAAYGLQHLPNFPAAFDRYQQDAPLVSVIGALLFFAVTMLHYLMIAFEDARDAERAKLEALVQTRDAELRALRAQINPHFLFNGLNAVASLAGSDPMRARTMCIMLADFLRRSLALGSHREISLAEELDLAERYLEIERVRFGERLRLERDVAPQALRCAVPALLLQPLVENAVTHGIAHSIEGGAVRLIARRTAGRLEIEVDNPADPERPASRGQGLGLANVRSRLASLHPGATRVESREAEGRYRVMVMLPAAERMPDPRPASEARAQAAPAEVA
jgi:two-component system, LytTR family, sensor histidine kinase AlgZ